MARWSRREDAFTEDRTRVYLVRVDLPSGDLFVLVLKFWLATLLAGLLIGVGLGLLWALLQVLVTRAGL